MRVSIIEIFKTKTEQEYSHNEGWKFQWMSLALMRILKEKLEKTSVER